MIIYVTISFSRSGTTSQFLFYGIVLIFTHMFLLIFLREVLMHSVLGKTITISLNQHKIHLVYIDSNEIKNIYMFKIMYFLDSILFSVLNRCDITSKYNRM